MANQSPQPSPNAKAQALSEDPLAGRHVSVGDVDFWVTELGSGEPVLFLHGLPTTSFLWRNIQRLMAAEYRTFAVDLVGMGKTKASAQQSLRLQDQAALVAQLLDALGLEQATIVAHDVGGAVAQYLVAAHPNRVRALVLLNTVAFARYWPVRLVKLMRIPLLGNSMLLLPKIVLRMLIKSRMRKGLFFRDRLRPAVFAEYVGRPLTDDGPRELLRLARGFDPIGLEKVIRSTHDSNVPRLILWGENDPYQPIKEGQELFDLVTAAKFVRLSKAGHFVPEDQPERVAEEILRYLRTLPPPY